MALWLSHYDHLFIQADPTEHNDIAASHPHVVQKLLARIAAANATAFSPDRGQEDPLACKTALGTYLGFWGPFLP